MIDLRGENIAEKHGEQIERHDQRLHVFRRLGVGEFQADNRDHDFRGGDDQIGQQLPGDRWSLAGVDPRLDQRDDCERGGDEKQTDADFPQRREWEHLVDQGINEKSKQRDVNQDQDWIDRLDL